MITTLHAWWLLLRTCIWLALDVYLPSRRRAKPKIAELEAQGLQLKRMERHRFYGYALYTTIMSQMGSLLLGRPLKAHEWEAAIYFGLFAPFCDDLMDQLDYGYKELLQHRERQHEHPYFPFLTRTYDAICAHLGDKALFEHYLAQVGAAQTASAAQRQSAPLGPDTLRRITYDKGGYSILLGRTLIDAPLSKEEAQVWYRLGSVVQFADDAHDVWRDLDEGQQTLFTEGRDVVALAQEFEHLLALLIGELMALPYPEAQKRRFAAVLLMLEGFNFVAFQQLMALQAAHGTFDARRHSRAELVADFETHRINYWYAIRYAHRWLRDLLLRKGYAKA